MIKVILFDLDDTLIEEKFFALSAFKEISETLEKKVLLNKRTIFTLFKNLYNESPHLIFDRFFEKTNFTLDNDYKNYLIYKYRNHYPKIRMSLSTELILFKLRRLNYKLGIISDGFKESQINKVNSLRLQKKVDYIILTDTLGREYWKPHSKSYEMMKEFFNCSFNEMVYVGDNIEKDFISPNILGIHSILLNKKNSSGFLTTLESIKIPKIIISDLNELFFMVSNL